MVVAGADDVTAALQWFEDQLQRCFGNVEALPLPHRRQNVQDVAAFLCICRHMGKWLSAHRQEVKRTPYSYFVV